MRTIASTAHRGKGADKASRARTKVKRNRLDPDVRAKLILRGAITFFAKHGFSGQTRELAAALGVSKGLLYRYFPSKGALIDRIYAEVFLRRWNPDWESILTDRSRSLGERLKVFYCDYAEIVREYEWVRIYLFAGLANASINRHYVKLVIERIYKPLINEFRHEFGFPAIEDVEVTEPELELMWNLHGSIFYIGMRKWVYGVGTPLDMNGAIERMVEGLYANAKNVMRDALPGSARTVPAAARTRA